LVTFSKAGQLRAGYLIWYHNVIRYLVEYKKISGIFLSDNFCNDEIGKAIGVAFVNFLLSASPEKPQISLPTVERFAKLDLISDAICGWVNSVKSNIAPTDYVINLEQFENAKSRPIDNIVFATDLQIKDKNGNDITKKIKNIIANA